MKAGRNLFNRLNPIIKSKLGSFLPNKGNEALLLRSHVDNGLPSACEEVGW